MNKYHIHLAVAYSAGFFQSMPRFGALELEYNSEDEIPENAREYYSQEGDKWILTGVKGGGKQNIDRLQSALEKERNDHKAVKSKLSKLNGRDIDELLQRDAEYEELKLRADKVDDEKLEQIINVRIRNKLTPLERERDELKNKLSTYEKQVEELTTKEKNRIVKTALSKAAMSAKVITEAIDDVELIGSRLFELTEDGQVVTRDGVGVTPGITPEMWLQDIQDKKPHWFPGNVGGGAGGSRTPGAAGKNPWSADGWNLTEQGKILRENPEKAGRLAAMVGVDLKRPVRPVKK